MSAAFSGEPPPTSNLGRIPGSPKKSNSPYLGRGSSFSQWPTNVFPQDLFLQVYLLFVPLWAPLEQERVSVPGAGPLEQGRVSVARAGLLEQERVFVPRVVVL
jgi:hypothetical protein